jgi:hypothetical protein
MKTKSNEALFFTASLVLLGLLSVYGGARWLALLVPAAVIIWLAVGIRCRMRDETVDRRVENRN